MCGIIGFVAPNPNKGYLARQSFLGQGLVVDSLRGNGGTGMALLKTDWEIETHKRALSGSDFVNSEVGEIGFRDFDRVRLAIGHNRAATIGSIKDRNCHPFRYKDVNDITLVHNGTLTGYYGMNPVTFTHDVDSAHAAFALARSTDIQKTLKSVKGPFVFIWWNATDKTFNIARNEFREIYYIYGEDQTLFYGSEWRMVDWLLERNNIDLKEKSKYMYPPDNRWMRWEMKDDGTMDKPKVINIEPEKVNYAQRFLPPYETARDRRNARRAERSTMESLGLKLDDRIIGEMECFVPYNEHARRDTSRGKIICQPKFTEMVEEIWIHNKERKDFIELQNKHRMHLPIRVKSLSMWTGKGGSDVPVIMGEIWEADLKELDEIKKETDRREAALKKALPAPNDNAGKGSAIIELNEFGYPALPEEKEVEEDSFPPLLLGPRNTIIPFAEYRKFVELGCAFCNSIPPIEVPGFDHSKIIWLDHQPNDTYLCDLCATNPEARDLADLPLLKTKESKAVIVVGEPSSGGVDAAKAKMN